MKKSFILALLLCAVGANMAQVITPDMPVVVYYMPKTELVIDLQYTVETEEAGPYYSFAEEMLGVDDVITDDGTYYSINNAEIHTRTLADYDRAYTLTAQANIDNQLVSLSSKGILRGYNITDEQPAPNAKKNKSHKSSFDNRQTHWTPISEEQAGAATLREAALQAAKQIFRIRESRMYLLGGEIEKAPADGQSMALVLNYLNEQEQQLMELFAGRRIFTQHTKTLYFTPEVSEEQVLVRWSHNDGFLNPDNTLGIPVLLQIEAHRPVVGDSVMVQDKHQPKASQLYYNLPGHCHVYVLTEGEVLAKRDIQVAQLGVAIPISESLLKQKAHILLDERTGNIRNITR